MSALVFGSESTIVDYYSSFLDMLGIEHSFCYSFEEGLKQVAKNKNLTSLYIVVNDKNEYVTYQRSRHIINEDSIYVFLIAVKPELMGLMSAKGVIIFDHEDMIKDVADTLVSFKLCKPYRLDAKQQSKESVFQYVKDKLLKGDAILPVKNDVALQMLPLLEDDKVELKKIGDLSKLDPSMHASLIKLANSVYFGSRYNEIKDMTQAFVRMGTTNVKTFLINYINKSLVANKDLIFNQEIVEAVDYSLYVGAICYVMAKKFTSDTNTMFSIGVLHEIGYIFMLAVLSSYLRNQDLEDGAPKGYVDLAKNNSIVASVTLMKKWKFPAQFYNTVQNQNKPDQSSHKLESRLLFISKKMYEYFKTGDNQIIEGLQKALGVEINKEQIEAIKNDADEHVKSIRALMK